MSANSRFRFRRQFVLGRAMQSPILDWQHVSFGPFDIHAHPDLLVTSWTHGPNQAVILGYVFDPDAPSRSNLDIVADLAQYDSFADMLDPLAAFGGTYAVLYRRESEACLVHDAGGLYEVYYTTDEQLVVGSQPALIGKVATLEEDTSEPALQLYSSEAYRRSGYPWAGDTTAYRNLRHLMPNHYLDLDRGTAVRYWPASRRIERSVATVADQAARWLEGFVAAAISRYTLSIGVSSGLDSRVLMAASRPYCQQVNYFIIPHPNGGSTDRADRRIAPRLARRLDVPLEVRPYGHVTDPEFASAFRESVTMGRETLMAEWYDVFYRQSNEDMTINGNVSEVARLYYERNPHASAEDLSRAIYGTVLPFAVKVYGRWLDEVRPLCEKYDYDVMDLFYWEERMGNWAAKGRTEMHLVTEVFTPYDCRRLLELLLSVDSSNRAKFDNALYREIIRQMWPDGLKEPFNPRLKLYVSKWMRKLKLYRPLMKIASIFRA